MMIYFEYHKILPEKLLKTICRNNFTAHFMTPRFLTLNFIANEEILIFQIYCYFMLIILQIKTFRYFLFQNIF